MAAIQSPIFQEMLCERETVQKTGQGCGTKDSCLLIIMILAPGPERFGDFFSMMLNDWQ